jgi:hypothetical protein
VHPDDGIKVVVRHLEQQVVACDAGVVDDDVETTATSAPSRASRAAVAAPIPSPAPVTTATLELNDDIPTSTMKWNDSTVLAVDAAR